MQQTEITTIVERAGALVAEHYVFEDLGARLRDVLAGQLAAGRYAAADGPEALGALVTADLQSANGDKHLRLKYHAEALPELDEEEAFSAALFTRQAAETLGGVARVDRLDGAVAHLELGPLLFPPSISGAALTAALQLVAGARALLLDLRGVFGGDPRTVAFVCSHLLADDVHLLTMHPRAGDSRQSWTHWVPEPRFGTDKPVYVLTSARTFSGGEELAYDLQQTGRATVVGETTGGGAHPRIGLRLHPHLEATVPTARPVATTSGTNWEGTGVLPDIAVPAAEAVATAHARALADLS